MTRYRTVLVPLDGSPQALCALPIAARVAESAGATLHVVHVGERTRPPQETLRQLGLSDEAVRGAVLDQATGEAAEEVVRLAHALPDPLIVLSTHTHAEKAEGRLGSTTEAVLRHFGCPVLLVPPEFQPTGRGLRRLLLPEDGTPTSATAIDPAAVLARRVGAEMVVLHVAEAGAPPPPDPGTLTAPLYLDQPQHEWPAWASEFVDRMTALGHAPGQLRLRLAVASGEPGAEIVDFATRHEIDLIVLACQPHWGERPAQTARNVILRSPIPILMTHTQQVAASAPSAPTAPAAAA